MPFLIVCLVLYLAAFHEPATAQPAVATPDTIELEIHSMFAAGEWEKALFRLRPIPDSGMNTKTRELLAMAYLYTANRLDATGHADKAKEHAQKVIAEGGSARFFVSRSRDAKNTVDFLLDATPGELAVSATTVQWTPQDGSESAPEKWTKTDITECALNPKYGVDSNSFHITLQGGKTAPRHDFRPLHFSADESRLVCALIGVSTVAPEKNKKK